MKRTLSLLIALLMIGVSIHMTAAAADTTKATIEYAFSGEHRLSRGYAGIAQGALLLNLPGSAGGIQDGLAVLDPILDHLLAQLGGSHEH